jgi:hypothetical protein
MDENIIDILFHSLKTEQCKVEMKQSKALGQADKKVFKWPKTQHIIRQINWGVDEVYGVNTTVLE